MDFGVVDDAECSWEDVAAPSSDGVALVGVDGEVVRWKKLTKIIIQ